MEQLYHCTTKIRIKEGWLNNNANNNKALHIQTIGPTPCLLSSNLCVMTQDRRYNYTTPKSYLELISLYKALLAEKRSDLQTQRERLESGVAKIAQASAQVADLQVNLKQEQIIVAEKKEATDKLIINIGQEKAIVDEAVEGSRYSLFLEILPIEYRTPLGTLRINNDDERQMCWFDCDRFRFLVGLRTEPSDVRLMLS
jgi:hypothetical protein